MRESKLLPILVLVLLVLSVVVLATVVPEPSSPQAQATQTSERLDEARQSALEWVAEASQHAPGMEIWKDATVGECTQFADGGGTLSALVFPVIKEREEVGYVTIDVQFGRRTVSESGLGPSPVHALPQARELAAQRLGTSPGDLEVRLIFLEPMTYLAEFTSQNGKDITFNLMSLREFPEPW